MNWQLYFNSDKYSGEKKDREKKEKEKGSQGDGENCRMIKAAFRLHFFFF